MREDRAAITGDEVELTDDTANEEHPPSGSAAANAPIPLRVFVSQDAHASGLVPDEPGWTVVGGRGFVGADHPQRGEFGRGFTFGPIAPTNAEGSLTAVWMPLRNQYGGAGYTSVEVVERTPAPSALPGGDAGVFKVRATRHGVPWEGWIHATTWRSFDGSTILQGSWILAPVDGDERVWPALKKAWEAYVFNAEAGAAELRHVREISAIIRGEAAPGEEAAK
jgi:hypothetical protein